MSRWLLILTVSAACGPKVTPGALDDQVDGGLAADAGPTLSGLGSAFDPTHLGTEITDLSTGPMADRSPATPGDLAVEDYITTKLTAAGLTVTREQFADATGKVTQNIIGTRVGLDPTDIIVVGAHHDTLPGLPGANDNASGVVSLIAIAEDLASRQLQRTIMFVSFGSEEEPGLADGAKYLLADPTFPAASVVFMLNLDMVGSYMQTSVVYALGATTSKTGNKLLEPMADASALTWELDLNDSNSDQVEFCKAKIPYTYLFTPDDACYHQSCDTPDRVDLPDLAQIGSFASDFVAQLANSTADLAGEQKQNGCDESGAPSD